MTFTAYETSSAQKRLYIINHLLGNSVLYNENRVWNIEGKLDPIRLKRTLEQLSLRHEILRTCFVMKDGEVLQKVYDFVDIDFTYSQKESITPSPQDIDAQIEFFLKPYDLAEAPLWKIGMVQWQGNHQSLLMDFHHIIADGISMDIFMRELGALYLGMELPEPEVQYVDFTIWQNDIFSSESMRKQESYWLKIFEGELPVLELPTDFPRPLEVDIAGTSIDFELDNDLTAEVNKLATRYNTSLYVVLLTVFDILLATYTNQEDIIVGTPVSGRTHREFENIIGMFVNTLAMRNQPELRKTFHEFLSEVSRNSFTAFENQDYQFEMLVEKVASNRQLNRNPIFDVMFALQNFLQDIDLSARAREELRIMPYHYKRRASKFDLTLQAFEVERHISFMLDYRTSLFRPETIERLVKHFINIFREVTANPGILLSDIQVISVAEKDQLISAFNDTEVEFPVDKTISQLFEEQVSRTPDHVALGGADLRGCPISLTYRQLNEQSDRLAGLLIEKGVLADHIVGIMVDRSIDTIVGILGIMKAGGAYLPIDPDYPQERIQYMLEDSGTRILLNKSEIRNSKFMFHTSNINSSNLAYIIYTSGSTGRPKGVMVENRNLVNLAYGLRERIYSKYSRDLKVALVAPYIFDASVKQVFGALILGYSLYIVPEDVRFDGEKLYEYYQKNAIDISDGTPTHLRLLMESRGGKNLPLNIKCFLIGGEPLTRKIVEKLFTQFEAHSLKIANVYGPTECCVDTTTYEISDKNVGRLTNIPIGGPMPNQQVYILNKVGHLQPLGVPGELCIGGASVSRGYLNNPELTAKQFNRSNRSYKTYILYKTGDLARWMVDPAGQGGYIIDFLGRIDQQVKIRGFRIETGEIENLLLKHDKISEAVVLAREDEAGNRYICAYVVGKDRAAFDGIASMELSKELKAYLSEMLPEYMIPSFFVLLEAIPVTPQGKVDKKSLPEPEKRSSASYSAPRDTIDEKLVEIWAEVLNIKSKDQGNQPGGISIDDNFFQLGGHSLTAAVLVARIHKELDAVVKMADIFKMPTIREISDFIRNVDKEVLIAIDPVEKKEYYPLSPAQNRLFLLHQVDPASTVYNIPLLLPLEGMADVEKLEEISRALLSRHESLRTSFHIIEDQPIQRIHEEVEFMIELLEARSQEAGIGFFIRSFDLSHAPLCRVGLIKTHEDKYLLVVDMHHIITDGISNDILAKEFLALLAGQELPFLRLQYKDYAVWENTDTRKESRKKQEAYWLTEFSGEIPLLSLPLDHDRPEVYSFKGDRLAFAINPELTAKIKKLTGQLNVTTMMMMFSVYNILLSKYSGQEEFVVGTVSAGRRHADLENIIGFFVNMLAIKTRPTLNKTFREYIMEVKEKTLNAYENQDYPFEELVEKLGLPRQPGRQPLVDTVFAFNEASDTGLQESQLQQNAAGESHFDLMIYITVMNNSMSALFEFSTDLFNKATIEEFSNSYLEILDQVAENCDTKLKQINVTLPSHLMAASSTPIHDDTDAWEL